MTPEPERDFAAHVRALCPEFREVGGARQARKSELLWGTIGDRAVIAKRLKKPSAVWEWYLDHEIAIYRAFAAHPPSVRAPRLVAAAVHSAGVPGLLVIDRLAGEPLATIRRPEAVLPIRVISALLTSHDQLATYVLKIPPVPANAPRPTRAQLRDRLLEDPTDPTWIRDGVRLCGRRGLIDDALAKSIDHALATYPAVTFSHGDLLLRNAIGDTDDEENIGLVDWECAGMHLRDWDLALLWTQLAGPARGIVEDAVRDSGVRWRAFLGQVAFAFARELRVLDTFPGGDAARPAIQAELAAVAARFHDAS